MIEISKKVNKTTSRETSTHAIMKLTTVIVLLFGSISLIQAAPETPYKRPINKDCVSISRSEASLFPEQFWLDGDSRTSQDVVTTIDNAVGFTVEYHPQYKVVKNNIANEIYVLYPCGVEPPSRDVVPKEAKFFQIPLTSISAPETIPYAFVELLGLEDRVRDVSAFVTAPCGQKILGCGRESIDLFTNASLLGEVGPYVDGVLTTMPYMEYPETFAFSASEDPGPLNRAEWVKFLGLFFNREKYASDVFNGLTTNYNKIKSDGESKSKENGGKSPTIAWISHFQFGDDENYQISFSEYKNKYITDAGGTVLDKDGISSIEGVRPSAFSADNLEFAWDGNEQGSFKTQEEAQAAFLEALKGVNVVIDETFALDPSAYSKSAFIKEFKLTNNQIDEIDALSDDRIFRLDGLLSETNGLDWFEGAIARPDKVLQDMIRVTDAGRGEKIGEEFTWIRRIDEEPVLLTADDCERLDSCEVSMTPICPFVKECGDGSLVLLTNEAGDDNEECLYEACPSNEVETPDAMSQEPSSDQNTASMAAPAVILLTVIIIFIEALVNWC